MWDYLCASADEKFIRDNGDYIETVLRKFSTFVGENGMQALPQPCFLDWPNENDPAGKAAGIHALFYWMMQCGVKLLQYLGREWGAVYAAQKMADAIVNDAKQKAYDITNSVSDTCDEIIDLYMTKVKEEREKLVKCEAAVAEFNKAFEKKSETAE
jgi:hypothetical protein